MIEAMKQALEAMEYADACLKKQLTTKTKHEYAQDLLMDAGVALRQAIEQAEKQGRDEYERGFIDGMQKQMESSVDKAVNATSKREWVSLTDAEIEEFDYYARDLVMDIEKALKERNA